jgi:hypothetical protein
MAVGQKNHYLPVSYLKQWAGPDGRLCEFSRRHKVVKARRRIRQGRATSAGCTHSKVFRRRLQTFSSNNSYSVQTIVRISRYAV